MRFHTVSFVLASISSIVNASPIPAGSSKSNSPASSVSSARSSASSTPRVSNGSKNAYIESIRPQSDSSEHSGLSTEEKEELGISVGIGGAALLTTGYFIRRYKISQAAAEAAKAAALARKPTVKVPKVSEADKILSAKWDEYDNDVFKGIQTKYRKLQSDYRKSFQPVEGSPREFEEYTIKLAERQADEMAAYSTRSLLRNWRSEPPLTESVEYARDRAAQLYITYPEIVTMDNYMNADAHATMKEEYRYLEADFASTDIPSRLQALIKLRATNPQTILNEQIMLSATIQQDAYTKAAREAIENGEIVEEATQKSVSRAFQDAWSLFLDKQTESIKDKWNRVAYDFLENKPEDVEGVPSEFIKAVLDKEVATELEKTAQDAMWREARFLEPASMYVSDQAHTVYEVAEVREAAFDALVEKAKFLKKFLTNGKLMFGYSPEKFLALREYASFSESIDKKLQSTITDILDKLPRNEEADAYRKIWKGVVDGVGVIRNKIEDLKPFDPSEGMGDGSNLLEQGDDVASTILPTVELPAGQLEPAEEVVAAAEKDAAKIEQDVGEQLAEGVGNMFKNE